MNKYPLRAMLTVRELREDQAARALRDRMAELDAAIAAWEAAKAEALACRQALRRKEDELMAVTIGRQVEAGLSRSIQRECQSWRARVDEAEAAVDAAAKGVDAAREAVEAARAAWQARSKDKHKIENHRDIWRAEADKEAQAAEEKELEESRKPMDTPHT